jgi:hypothetical protein
VKTPIARIGSNPKKTMGQMGRTGRMYATCLGFGFGAPKASVHLEWFGIIWDNLELFGFFRDK